MSSSTDSLKKKVCVTVFLDELFEEVLDDDWKELRQINKITGSGVKIAEKLYSVPSKGDLNNDEKVKVSLNANSEQLQGKVRPRKHRRESKFSKNHCDSFENRNDYGSRVVKKNEGSERFESTASESDYGLDEFLKLDKWKTGKESTSSEVSEIELKKDSFLSINPILSSVMILNSREMKISKKKPSAFSCNKATQFDGVGLESKKLKKRLENKCYVKKKERQAVEDVLDWKETQKRIHLILTKSRHWEKETCEGDYLRRYDLKSILEGCTKTKENTSSKNNSPNFRSVHSNPWMDLKESDLLDSYTCIFPHAKQRNRAQAPKLKKIWTRTNKGACNGEFESNLSERGCISNLTERSLHSSQKGAFISCDLGLKSEEKSREEENRSSDAVQPLVNFECSRESSFEIIKSRAPQKSELFYRTVFDLARKTVLEAKLKTEPEKVSEDAKNEGIFPLQLSKSLLVPESRNKNFAEGDTLEEFLNQDSKLILDIKAKEKSIVCEEILKSVAEPKVAVHNEIIVSRAEIEFDSQENVKNRKEIEISQGQSLSVSAEVAEVYFKQNGFGNIEKSMTDIESAMIFAESQNFCDHQDFVDNGNVCSFTKESERDVCVVEFEDKLSRSKILRRAKTVEILGDTSLNDMRNVSTEVILICENISNNEAWHKSTSAMKSITEMSQCYLKDTKDSTMYLIEIPLRFTYGKRKKRKSKQLFKCTDSD